MFGQMTAAGFWRRITGPIDRSLDNLTTYKLILYFLRLLFLWALVLSLTGVLPYMWYELVLSAGLLIGGTWASSWLFAKYLEIPRNSESDFITGGILALILIPVGSPREYLILGAVAFLAAASKYVLIVGRRHILNPAAVGAFAAAVLFDYPPGWWISNRPTAPLIILGGLVILRKMKRFSVAAVFLGTFLAVSIINAFSSGNLSGSIDSLKLILLASPLLFFTFVMLIEPLTSPAKRSKAAIYALFVGLLYSVAELGFSLEESLLFGNILAFLMTRDRRLVLEFVKKKKEAEGIYSFIFSGKRGLDYKPGQYLLWTLRSRPTDRRGNRRYLTISSSPTEDDLRLSVKIPEPPSSFKKTLSSLTPGDRIYASQLAGEFMLPADQSQKLAFLAGGVGITPFRSMAKYLADTGQSRDICLLYSANSASELAFKDLFKSAEAAGLKTVYFVSPPAPAGGVQNGPLDAKSINKLIPDFKERSFYISGPYGFVQAMQAQLAKLGVDKSNIKLDYFPGYG